MEQQANQIAKMHMKSRKVDTASFFLLVKVLMNMAKKGTTDQFDRMMGVVYQELLKRITAYPLFLMGKERLEDVGRFLRKYKNGDYFEGLDG